MALADRKALKQAAGEVLEQNRPAAKRTVLLYAGISAAVLFGIMLVNVLLGFLLERVTEGASGLDSLGTVSALETVQGVLDLAASVLPTFWAMGYLFVLLQMAAGEQVRDGMLLQGFRKFGPILRKALLEGLLVFALAMAGTTVGSTLLTFTPLAKPMMDAMVSFGDTQTFTEQQMLQLTKSAMPMLIGCFVIAMVLVVLVMYRLRLSNYVLMEEPQYGAIYALITSFRLTKGHYIRLLLLELSFWWYYVAVTVAGLLPLVLPLFGVSGLVWELAVYAAALLLQFGIQYLASNKVEMTFVQAYRELCRENVLPQLPEKQDQPRQNPFA